jgi:hypothetical protein
MGISKNPLLKDFHGHIDKTIVVKQYPGDVTVITAYPDMTHIVPTEAQKEQRLRLKAAQAKASEILKDPVLKAEYQERCGPGKRAYNLIISELMKSGQF